MPVAECRRAVSASVWARTAAVQAWSASRRGVSQIPDGHLHERRTGGVAIGEIQQRREETNFRKRLRQKIRAGLCDWAKVGIPTIVGMCMRIDMRKENHNQNRRWRKLQHRAGTRAGKQKPNSTSNHRASPHRITPHPCPARKRKSRRAGAASASSAPAESRCAARSPGLASAPPKSSSVRCSTKSGGGRGRAFALPHIFIKAAAATQRKFLPATSKRSMLQYILQARQ